MSWFIFSLISISALAAAELLQQHILNGENTIDEKSSTILTFGSQSILALILIFILGLNKDLFSVFTPNILPIILASSFTAAMAMIFYLRSFRVKNISFSSMFISLSVVVSTILGIIVFQESVSLMKLIGIGLVLFAIFSLNFSNSNLEKKHLYGLLAGVFFGITYTLDKLVVIDIHPLVYLFWSFTFVISISFLQNPKNIITSAKGIRLIDARNLFVSGFAYFIYNLCTFTAYTVGGEVGRVDAINNSQVFLIILFEYFVFKHISGIKRKLITAAIAFLGVYILGSF